MKKLILSLLTLLCCSSLTFVHAADYYVAHNAVMNSNNWNASGDKMSKVGSTDIYQITFANVSTSKVEFKVTDGSWSNSWGYADANNAISEFSLSNSGGNASFTLGSTSNVTIYFNSTNKKIFVYKDGSSISYTVAGASDLLGSSWNTSADAGNDMTRESDGITYTLTRSNVHLTSNQDYKVVKNHAWGTGEFPSSGNQTLSISSDGIYNVTFTYVPGLASLTAVATPVAVPIVSLVSLGSNIAINEDLKFSASSNNINGEGVPATSYKFYVKKGSGSYSSAVTHYQFTSTGSYTVKVEAYDSSDEKQAETEQTITVIEDCNILYYVKTNDWGQVNAYMWDGSGNNVWPGSVMSLTTTTTTRSGYPVYSVAYTTDYDKLIFSNNGNDESANLDIDTDKPYYYDGEWYATLAECDAPVLTTNFYLAGSFNSWSTTANRFMKENEDDTEASVTITINEYSNISFKVIDNGNWRGVATATTITKDATSVTIANEEGANIGLTPYAAGDYVFTLNLSTRELTVSYPDGDPMPIPTNIYLSCDELNDWAAADANYKFDVDEENDLATLEVDLDEETQYAFKLVYNDAWMGANYDFKYYWCTDVPMIVDATQANLYSFKAGTYTFRYKLSTSELSIVYPATDATTVHVSQYEYATLYSSTAFDVPDNVDAFVVTGTEGIRLTLERIYRIPAETGVLLHAAEGDYDFYEGDGRYMDAVTTNYFKGSLTNEAVDNSLVHYVLSYSTEGEVGFFWPYGTGANAGVGSFTNNAGKAYLEMPTQSAGVMARRGYLLTDQEEVYTLLDATVQTLEQGKFIENGQLLIIHDGQLFNAQGVRVK